GTTIQISARRKNKEVEITFSNRGKKIPGTKLQTIFEKFYRLDDSRSSETGGAGMGLAIAKDIVERHGGRIMARSDDEKTQCIVTLPSGKEQEEKEENEVHTHRGRAFRGASRGRKGIQRGAKRRNLGKLPKTDQSLQK